MQRYKRAGVPGAPPPPPYPPPSGFQAGGDYGSGYAGGYNAGYGGSWAGPRPPSKFSELQEKLVSARMEKRSAELKLDNERALHEKDRELEEAKAVIDKKKKKKEIKRIRRRVRRAYLLTTTAPAPRRRRPGEEEDDADIVEEDEEKIGDSVQQTEEVVRDRFKAAAGTKRMVDILKATKKFPATWDKAKHNGGQTRPARIKHRMAADAELWGAKKHYSWMRSYVICNYVYLPVAAFSGKRDCNAGEKALIRAAQHPATTLNTSGSRATNKVTENVVDIQPGLLESTSWKVVKLLYGYKKVSATVLNDEGETRLAGKSWEVVNEVKRRAVQLKFEKGVTAVWDLWASEVVKKPVRTPETTVELYRSLLEQLVRLFEAVRADLPRKDRAQVRRHISLAAKMVHNFTLKGVYPLKLPPADTWKSYGVRKVTEEMVKDLRIPTVVENFVKRRTMPVMTSTDSIFSITDFPITLSALSYHDLYGRWRDLIRHLQRDLVLLVLHSVGRTYNPLAQPELTALAAESRAVGVSGSGGRAASKLKKIRWKN
ncbi:hypothetical protein CYMTET_3203 [Cymbomonas tetramitiformis]|uniref:Uncharacterized protein n=1 Tax=Cymbomonas tetramitiformis TaxID=36881 RepID=A0AAE0LL32_9CHLO|nr:hypothetical protein CYMTET_3203 [Cymbomonas tetramitiformis]